MVGYGRSSSKHIDISRDRARVEIEPKELFPLDWRNLARVMSSLGAAQGCCFFSVPMLTSAALNQDY